MVAVFADAGELSWSSYQRWAWLHVLVVPLVIVACAVVLAVLTKHTSAEDSAEVAPAAVS